jgi:TatD DNase family protein
VAWFDVGVNLTDRRFKGKVEDVIVRAAEEGVSHLLTIGTSLDDSLAGLALTRQYSELGVDITCTAGFHPHQAKVAKPEDMDRLRTLLDEPNVVAIGECGLDFNRNFSPPDVQLSVFEQQLMLATDVKLPIYLHEREAFDDQVKLLKKYESGITGGLVHCFTGDSRQLECYLELGLSVGITGWVCDPERGGELREAIQYLPLDKLLVETDAPYLTPKNIRPRPKYNQPSLVPQVAKAIADIKQVSLAEIEEHSFNNARRLFLAQHEVM